MRKPFWAKIIQKGPFRFVESFSLILGKSKARLYLKNGFRKNDGKPKVIQMKPLWRNAVSEGVFYPYKVEIKKRLLSAQKLLPLEVMAIRNAALKKQELNIPGKTSKGLYINKMG